MRKFLSVMLIIALAFSITSCGKPKELKELEELTKALSKLGTEEGADALNKLAESYDDEDSYDDEYSYDDQDSYDDEDSYDFGDFGSSVTQGVELSGFYAYYNEALTSFEAPINNWETDDFLLMGAAMDYLSPSLHLISMGLYDSLEFFGYDEGEYKEVDGNIVKFGKEFTRNEDGFSPNDKVGDVVGEKGILDISSQSLTFESYTKRDGKMISRGVTEIVSLSDGTFIVQTFSKNPLVDDRLEDKGDAYFLIFDSNKLEVIKATFTPDVNFNFDSIIGKGNMTVEDMAQGYTLVRKMTIADDTANVETY